MSDNSSAAVRTPLNNILTPKNADRNDKPMQYFEQGITPPIFKGQGPSSCSKQPMSFVQQQFFNGPIISGNSNQANSKAELDFTK